MNYVEPIPNNLRFSVSQLERYHWWKMTGGLEPESRLLEDLTIRRSSPHMTRGIRVHKWLETNGREGGPVFVDKHLDIKLMNPHRREQFCRKTWNRIYTDMSEYSVMLVGRVDGIWHKKLIEYKTTAQITQERRIEGHKMGNPYLDSAQWRLYLDMVGIDVADSVVYEIFQVKEQKDFSIRTRDHIRLEATRYPELEEENTNLIREFVQWLEVKNLTHPGLIHPQTGRIVVRKEAE